MQREGGSSVSEGKRPSLVRAPVLLKQCFGLDYRSMALYRIVVSALLIVDLWNRSYYIHDHYSSLAIWPLASSVADNNYSFSFHYISGSYGFQAFLMLVAAACAFCTLIGWHWRMFAVANWLMLCSIQTRNMYLLDGGDDFIRMFTFWSMFVPLAERCSIDSLPSKNNKRGTITNANNGGNHNMKGADGSSYHVSFGTLGVWTQFALIYLFTAYLKWAPEWTTDYTATQYALGLDHFLTRFGQFMQGHPLVLKFLTWIVLWFEKAAPIMLIMPVWNGPMRVLSVLGIWAMHIGFGSCLNLGMFVVTPGVCSLIFLPAWFWEVIVPFVRAHAPLPRAYRTPASAGPVTIYTRGDRTWMVATTFSMFFLWNRYQIVDADARTQEPKTDKAGVYSPSPAIRRGSVDGVTLDVRGAEEGVPLSSDHDFGVEYQGKRSSGYLGVLSLFEASCLWFLCPLLRLRVVCTGATRVANFLRRMEAQYNVFTSWVYPSTPRKFRNWKVTELIALFFTVFVVYWNFCTFYRSPINPKVFWIGPTFKVDQWWGMFAPHPPKEGGWFVIHGINAAGEQVNVFREGDPVTLEKPDLFSATIPSHRWRTYLLGLPNQRLADNRVHYGRYLCREWNFWGRHPGDQQLKSFKIIYMREETRLDDVKVEAVPMVLWEHTCF